MSRLVRGVVQVAEEVEVVEDVGVEATPICHPTGVPPRRLGFCHEEVARISLKLEDMLNTPLDGRSPFRPELGEDEEAVGRGLVLWVVHILGITPVTLRALTIENRFNPLPPHEGFSCDLDLGVALRFIHELFERPIPHARV